MKLFFLPSIMLSLALIPAPAKADYTLNLKNGKFPKGTVVANENGITPDANGYKRGWTDNGWIVGQFGNRGYVALSPTFHSTEDPCENTLTLPTQEIVAGNVLSWEARSLLPGFAEAYTVEACTEDSNWTTLLEVNAESDRWMPRAIDLSQFDGKATQLRFVCRSGNGYMLAIDQVNISSPSGPIFRPVSQPRRFYSTSEHFYNEVNIDMEYVNIGATSSIIQFEVTTEFGEKGYVATDGLWETGQVRSYDPWVHVEPDVKTAYTIHYISEEGPVLVSEDFVYRSKFIHNLMVDEGTGMWCNNCPTGMLAMEDLASEYGENFIGICTHTNDMLANDPYFSGLAFRAIPTLMLDRIQKSQGNGAENFADYICVSPEAGLKFEALWANGETLHCKVAVNVADNIDNADGRYRVGYVATTDFSGSQDPRFYQENSCSQPASEQYYYLPSTIPASLARFPHTSLTSATAFEGMENSLPALLEPDKDYEAAFEITLPEKLGMATVDPASVDVVAFVIDTTDGHIVNAAKASCADFAAVDTIVSSPSAPQGTFTLEGIRANDDNSLTPGLYIRNGKKIIIK